MLTQLNLYNFSLDNFGSKISEFESELSKRSLGAAVAAVAAAPLTPPYNSPYEYTRFMPAFYSPMTLNDFDKFRLFTSPPSPYYPLTPPLSNSPPTDRSPYSVIETSSGGESQSSHRTQSVIMRIEDQKIVPVNSKQYGRNSSSSESEDESHICKWTNCYRQFSSLEHLAMHVTKTHANASMSGLYYCNWENCARSDRGFNARYKMLVHVRIHTKEKPHHCNECPKSFSRAENLKIHIRSHSGEKPYLCPVDGCNKAYSNSSDRFKHTRTHATEKPYVCKHPSCNKRYTDPSSLRKHVKTFKHVNVPVPADTAESVEKKTNTCSNNNDNGSNNNSSSNNDVSPLSPSLDTKDKPYTNGKQLFINYRRKQQNIVVASAFANEALEQYHHSFIRHDCLQRKLHEPQRDIYSLDLERLFKENSSIVSPALLHCESECAPSYWSNEKHLGIEASPNSMDIEAPLDLSLRKRVR